MIPLYNMLLQGISHAIKSVALNSIKIFAGGKPLDPQMKLASLAPSPPQSEILATPLFNLDHHKTTTTQIAMELSSLLDRFLILWLIS